MLPSHRPQPINDMHREKLVTLDMIEASFNPLLFEKSQNSENPSKQANSIIELAKSNFSGVDLEAFQISTDADVELQETVMTDHESPVQETQTQTQTQEKRFIEALIVENSLRKNGNEEITEEGIQSTKEESQSNPISGVQGLRGTYIELFMC